MNRDYIFYTDKFLNITSWGRGISLFTGIKSPEAIGKKYYNVINKINLGNVDALSKAIKDDRVIIFKDHPFISATGQVRVDLMISARRNKNNVIQGAKVKVSHNPSQVFSKNMESMESCLDFFEAASYAHGLRGPLNIIKGISQSLRDNYHNIDEIRESADLIDDAVNNMNEVVSRFLDLPKKTLQLSDVDINTLLRDVCRLISQKTSQKKIKTFYSFADLPVIKAENLKLRLAIMNVIDNAIEAMPSGGELKIATETKNFPEGEFVIISISDTGHGLKTYNKKADGYRTSRGLGLTLTRLIVQCYGGWMKINNDATGTTVKLYLPAKSEVKND
ncbi:MAG: ATP-binding protein [Thermodesulfovibrionales bacterium]